MEKKNETCSTCAADFKRNLNSLVEEGHYTQAEHTKKAAEVVDAFGPGHAHPQSRGAAAPTVHPQSHGATKPVDAHSGSTNPVHTGNAAHAAHSAHEGHSSPGMSGTLAGTAAHHRVENTEALYHDSHYRPDRPAMSPEHHRLHHEAHHQHLDRKK